MNLSDLHHDRSEVNSREVRDFSPAVDVENVGTSLGLIPGRVLGPPVVVDDDCKRKYNVINKSGTQDSEYAYLVHLKSTSRPYEGSGVHANSQ